MLQVMIRKMDGTLIFAGTVDERDVEIRQHPNAPDTASVKVPVKDMLAHLADQPIAPDYADSAE